jgi:C-methyltransferase
MQPARNWSMSIAADSPQQLLGHLSRLYVLSRAIHAVAELGLSNHIGDAPAAAADISSREGLDASFVSRLISYLAAYGIFEETSPGFFRANELSRLLRDDAPGSMRAIFRMVSVEWWNAAGHLPEMLREGRSGIELAYGRRFFDLLTAHPPLQQRFDEGMSNISRMDDKRLASSYDFSGARVVADLAGGKGTLLREILLSHPEPMGLLFERPQVLNGPTALDDLVGSGRARLVPGNLLETLPSPVDIYVIKGALHVFADRETSQVLGNCAHTMRKGDRLLIIEQILPADSKPHPNKTMDMVMMLLLGSRLRTVEEWSRLLEQNGLEVRRTIPTSTAYTMVEATLP